MSEHHADGHPNDEFGEPVHVDIDPFIPTGACAICADVPQETEAPENRNHERKTQ